MAVMATTPVFACRICKAPVVMSAMSFNDASAEKLNKIMPNLYKVALCPHHRRVYNWYAKQGRSNEFLLNPDPILYQVIDNSGLDYYKRKG